MQDEVESRLESASPKPWWERIGRKRSPEELAAFDQAVSLGRYFRKTGKLPPEDWKVGDPIGY